MNTVIDIRVRAFSLFQKETLKMCLQSTDSSHIPEVNVAVPVLSAHLCSLPLKNIRFIVVNSRLENLRAIKVVS